MHSLKLHYCGALLFPASEASAFRAASNNSELVKRRVLFTNSFFLFFSFLICRWSSTALALASFLWCSKSCKRSACGSTAPRAPSIKSKNTMKGIAWPLYLAIENSNCDQHTFENIHNSATCIITMSTHIRLTVTNHRPHTKEKRQLNLPRYLAVCEGKAQCTLSITSWKKHIVIRKQIIFNHDFQNPCSRKDASRAAVT